MRTFPWGFPDLCYDNLVRQDAKKGDSQWDDNIDKKAEAKTREVLGVDEPLEAGEKNSLDHDLTKGLTYNFWNKNVCQWKTFP